MGEFCVVVELEGVVSVNIRATPSRFCYRDRKGIKFHLM